MAGAGLLAVSAAVRSGAGKTTWVTTRETYRAMGRSVPEAMSLIFPEARDGGFPDSAERTVLARVSAAATAFAAGPGLGRTASVRRLVRSLVRRLRVPSVIDADALWAFEGAPALLRKAGGPLVLTPHAGEFERLFGLAPGATLTVRRSVAKRIANQYHCVLVLKGAPTLVAAPGQNVFTNTTGNAGLAKGGSGDVLTGVIAGLLAQGFDPWTAARVGTYAHGRAADLAVRKGSLAGLAASDLLVRLNAVWSELEKKKDLIGFAAVGFRRGR